MKVRGNGCFRRHCDIPVVLLDTFRHRPSWSGTAGLFDDAAELYAALGSNEPLTRVFENGLARLGKSDFKDDTGTAAGGNHGGKCRWGGGRDIRRRRQVRCRYGPRAFRASL